MSSDSEDDCYGNIAQKLYSIKSKYTEDNIKTTNILGDSSTNAVSSISSQNADKPVVIDLANAGAGSTVDCNSTFNSLDGDDNILDQIIATNTKKKARKSKTITSDISIANILPERASRRKRGRASTADLTTSDVSQNISTNDINTTETPNLTLNESVLSDSSAATVNNTRGKRGAKRGRRGRGAAANSPRTVQPSAPSTTVTAPSNTSTSTTVNSVSANSTINTALNSSRGSGRGRRGRGRGTTPRRPRQRRRNYGWFSSRRHNPFNPFTSIFNEDDDDMASDSSVAALLNALTGGPSNSNTPNYPTYSVGNTYEYPDESHGQQLFQNKPAPSKDVEIIENNDDTEIDNEELSVKVYWQNLECVKFNIRKYQKLSQIFDHFAQKENVTHDKLFFTYNDKILKSTDTPDSIGYNIAKFIDGGIIKQNVSQLVKDTGEIKNGIALKFQCQTKRTPFITNIKKDDKLLVAMMKCAENLDQPVSKLKFYFDGDLITGKNTAEELELEGGECIDVKIIS